MTYNYIKQAHSIRRSGLCKYDTTVGFATDFSRNGDVDSWTYYDGIHTYGCWNNFLFGTSYTTYAVVGRSNVFAPPLSSDDYYVVSLTMRLKGVEREGSHSLPSTGKVMWRTFSDPSWDDDKSMEFSIYPDNTWHVYDLNMGEAQWWQGDINDIRIYPFTDCMAGDEFFIQSVKILSVNSFKCINITCSYRPYYSHPCQGVGSRFTCESTTNTLDLYTISENTNDEMFLNINEYGNEHVIIKPFSNITGYELARELTKSINKVGVGGYAEAEVDYDGEENKFYINSGTYSADSTVVINNSTAAVYMGFYDDTGNSTYTTSVGRDPADKSVPESSFLIETGLMLSLFDSDNANINFDPFSYAIEGGRSDWLESSLGQPTLDNDLEDTNITYTTFEIIDNRGKTIIDFNHPFNASGRIKNIVAACTLDNTFRRGTFETYRDESSGCKLFILRPRKNGMLKVIHTVDIEDRQQDTGALYSALQEYVDINCDILVNKGDLIGIYNANVYVGLSIGDIVDAQYYQITGEVSGVFDPGTLYGDGSAGILFYARSEFTQNVLAIDVDLGSRINIDDVVIEGTYEDLSLEFNVARCLDINWSVDLFNGQHETSHLNTGYPGRTRYTHDNIAYGINNLSDGTYTVNDGKSADSFSIGNDGVVPSNPYYFWVNGDCEWLGIFQNASLEKYRHAVTDFQSDPIALTLLFPYAQTKSAYKSRIFFKEYNNFRNFALSTYIDDVDTTGNADNPHYNLVPEYTNIVLDGIEYYEGSDNYEDIDEYLFENPCNAHPEYVETLNFINNGGFWDGIGYGYINNLSEYYQVIRTDWTTIEHTWEPISCKGFRIYCDYHKSTKITEIEVYCEADFEGTALINGINVSHSKYEDLWWISELTSYTDSVSAFVADTSRYFRLNISPTTLINLKNISFNVKSGDVFIGEKGCEDVLLLDNCKIDSSNAPNRIDIENVYGFPYDLHVDISEDDSISDGLLFYSRMNNEESVTNPEEGPDATYYKEDDYVLTMTSGNCAINCECYGLKNLIDGKAAHYSYDNALNWEEYGTLYEGELSDFSNHDIVYTDVQIPNISRNRYWKIKPKCDDITYNVREIKIFRDDIEIDCDLYHEKTLNPYLGPITDTAPHLDNGSVTGSYYIIGSQTIGFDLGATESIDKIRMYHDIISDWSRSVCGIDRYTALHVGVDEFNNIIDDSYYEHTLNIHGTVGLDHSGPFPGSTKPKAVSFGGMSSDYISVPFHEKFNFSDRRANIDFWAKFNSMPAHGDYAVLARNWAGTLPPTIFDPPASEPSDPDLNSFCFLVTSYSGIGKIEFHYTHYDGSWKHQTLHDEGDLVDIIAGNWYHFAWTKAMYTGTANSVQYNVLSGDSTNLDYDQWVSSLNMAAGNQDIILGQGLDGSIANFRIMVGDNTASPSDNGEGTWILSSESASTAYMVEPIKPWEKYYSFIVFSSSDDVLYGRYSDVDSWGDHSSHHYESDNKFNESYYSYFAVDLEKRYTLDIIRNYGASDALDLTGNILYSNDDLPNPADIDINSGSISDVRWVIIQLFNDSTERNIRKLGIYPNINTLIAPGGGYNNDWAALGSSVSDYEDDRNIALYADIVASSYWGSQDPSILTDGVIGEDMSESWLSDTDDEQWLVIDLGSVFDVYRFKIYHGYDESDTNYMVKDYTIQTSISGTIYQTQFSIIDNNSFERTHDLVVPVEARYIKLNITDYDAIYKYIRIGGQTGFFGGAVLRQVEVYNYYGYTVISSEQYPIIAINLKDQFYIRDHSITGIDAEDTSTGWSNDNSDFTYTDSILSEPRKISFNGWGATPNYEQWVAVKRDTATDYNSGPDYLKHVVISATDNPNPCDNDWWWVSRLSTISRDYSIDTNISIYGLKIEYPSSSGIENIYLRNGDNFGIDDTISWRDNFYFRMYIDNVSNLDLDYGYIYFGGNDISHNENIVSYQWNISTLSGSLNTGWNTLNLKFKDADYIEYTEQEFSYDDPRIFSNLTMEDIGIIFRGIGNPLTMYLDGFKIKRNHFDSDSRFYKGLYLNGNDYISCPFSNFSMSKGTVEFWLRPDYTSGGMDFFNTFKNRSLFTVTNVDNDVLGVSITMSGFSIYFGKLEDTLSTYFVSTADISVDELFHFALVYSSTGEHISSDGSTLRLYFNNRPITRIMESWTFGDNKYFKFILGGEPPMAVKENSSSMESSSIDGVISDLKIYNYCKTDFYDSMENIESDNEGDLIKPSRLISISKDNLTYYNVGDSSLPFLFEKVPAGDSVPVYVKSNIPKGLTNQEKRTSGLVIQWDIGV